MTRLGVIIGCACLSATTWAQTPKPNQAEADKYFAEGRALLGENQAVEACQKFEKAIELDPTAPGVMLNLGLCNELQGKYATSLYWFRKAQFAAAEAKPEPLVEYEEAAKQKTADLATKVAVVKIDVSQAPPDVRVSVDGRPVLPADYLRLEVDSGSTIEARAPGKTPFRQQVTIKPEAAPGQNPIAEDIVITMQDQVQPRLLDPGKGRRRLAYILAGGGVVMWGVTLVYGITVRNEYERGKKTQEDHDDAKHKLRYYGSAMFAVGAAAVGAAIVLYVTAPKPYREKLEQTAVVPIVTPDQIGLGYATSF